MDTLSINYKQAVCGHKYRKSTWVCFLLSSLNTLSGINALTMYANRLLTAIKEHGDHSFPFTPIQGTYIIGITQAVAAFAAMGYAEKLNRRTIFIYGYVLMVITQVLCGVCVMNDR